MGDSNIKEYALKYAQAGIAIYPLYAYKKFVSKGGWNNTTTDTEQVEKLFTRSNITGIAMCPLKSANNIVCIDVDMHKGNGIKDLEEKEKELGKLPREWSQKTTSDGERIIVRTRDKIADDIALTNNIDIICGKHCVVLAPSKAYKWQSPEQEKRGEPKKIGDYSITRWEGDLPPVMPEKWETYIKGKQPTRKDGKQGSGDPIEIKRELSEIAKTEGNRHDTLKRYMASIFSRTKGKLSDDEYKAILEKANSELPEPFEEKEYKETMEPIISWLRQQDKGNEDSEGNKEPRKIPPLRSINTLLKQDLAKLRVFVGVGADLPLLVEGTCILSSKPKMGKSYFALEMGAALTKGSDFLGYKTSKCSVLYLDLETVENLKQERARKIEKIVGGFEDTFYIQDESEMLDGFSRMIDAYMKDDSEIGVVIVDVFQKILPATNSRQTDYEIKYSQLAKINEISRKYHISIILVCHDKKSQDPSDPFSNILGSTALQGATDQMIVLYKEKIMDEITHIAAKGRTIDGIVDIDACMVNSMWTRQDRAEIESKAESKRMDEYYNSDIRKGVLIILQKSESWQGKCTQFIQDCATYNHGVIEEPKEIGFFLTKNVGLFLNNDGIRINIIKNGTGSRMYRFEKSTIDTIDENPFTIDEKSG